MSFVQGHRSRSEKERILDTISKEILLSGEVKSYKVSKEELEKYLQKYTKKFYFLLESFTF